MNVYGKCADERANEEDKDGKEENWLSPEDIADFAPRRSCSWTRSANAPEFALGTVDLPAAGRRYAVPIHAYSTSDTWKEAVIVGMAVDMMVYCQR
jgi:hypothetical protein